MLPGARADFKRGVGRQPAVHLNVAEAADLRGVEDRTRIRALGGKVRGHGRDAAHVGKAHEGPAIFGGEKTHHILGIDFGQRHRFAGDWVDLIHDSVIAGADEKFTPLLDHG